MIHETEMGELHYQMVRSLIDDGLYPGNSRMAERLGVDDAQMGERLRELAGIHGVVLDPHSGEPWVVHPFSLTPTMNWVEGETRGWWAPCVWCALGVAALVGGRVTIHTRWGGESEPVAIPVDAGRPAAGPEMWCTLRSRPPRPGTMSIGIARWCCRSGRARKSARGAPGMEFRQGRRCPWSRWPVSRGPGMAAMPTATGASGPLPKHRRSSAARGWTRRSGIWARSKGGFEAGLLG